MWQIRQAPTYFQTKWVKNVFLAQAQNKNITSEIEGCGINEGN